MYPLLEILLLLETIVLVTLLVRKCSAPAFLDEVMDASEYGEVIFDKKGKFLKANKCARSCLQPIIDGEIHSFTRYEFLNCLYDNAADFDESIKNTIFNGLDGKNVSEFREVIFCKDKGLFLVEAKNIGKGMTLFVLTDINIGQRREKDIIYLSSLNQQLMHAVQATTSGIVISDTNSDIDLNTIIFSNEAFCEFVNFDADEVVSSGWNVIIDLIKEPEDKVKFEDAIANAKDVDLVLESGVGEDIRYFNMKLTPAMNDIGELELFIGVLSEITLLKQRESEFFHVQKLESLGKLSAGVAHDFNNILSIIGGYSVMSSNMLKDLPDTEQIINYLSKIDAASQRGADLTSKMLTFSKHKIVSKTIVNVCDVVKEQGELLIPLLGVSVNLKIKMSDDSLNVKGNAGSLGQILMNFAVNGRDAMEDGGTLSINIDARNPVDVPSNIRKQLQADEYVCISVSDTGTGMDEATIKRIFDPFFSTKDQGKGTGLGLSVVYGLAQEMGGILDVSSVVGSGTKMCLYVPRCYEAQTKKITGSEADLSTICLDGYSVLVAEDEPDLLILVTNMLEEMGLTVYGASDGDEALVLLDDNLEKGIDILLTDVVMPGLNGVKLAELVASLSPETDIIFMSGYPANGDMAPVELPDDLSFVAKPVDYNALAALLLQKLRKQPSDAGSDVDMPRWKTSAIGGVSSNG